MDGLETDCFNDRKSGFIGKVAIHPAQSSVINKTFTPSEDEITYAKKVVAVFEENPGLGVVGLEGKMLDMPHLKQQVVEDASRAPRSGQRVPQSVEMLVCIIVLEH